jgi:hypothetical protein
MRKHMLPLVQTHLLGDRRREQWLTFFAERSAMERWSLEKSELEVRKAAELAIFADRILTEKSFKNVVAEGRLATHPDVRAHVPRLISLRDEAWLQKSSLLRASLHGPSQVLIDMMRRQRNPAERRYVTALDVYFDYLERRFAA